MAPVQRRHTVHGDLHYLPEVVAACFGFSASHARVLLQRGKVTLDDKIEQRHDLAIPDGACLRLRNQPGEVRIYRADSECNPRGPRERSRAATTRENKRRRIFARDGFACLRCGETNEDKLTLDHIKPKAQGGTDADENLQTLCEDCNQAKGNRSVSYREESYL